MQEQEEPLQQARRPTAAEQRAIRAKSNTVLNYVDFFVLTFSILLLIILATTTSAFDVDPLMTFLFVLQMFLMYLTFRTRYAIDLPFMWCSSCDEGRHLRFTFGSAFFACFVIFCDVLDLCRSIFTHEGLVQRSIGLFILELFSLAQAIFLLVCIWRYPKLVMSQRAAAREIDFWQRRQRARFSYGVPTDDPEEERRRREEYNRAFPRYEDLEIEEVQLDDSQCEDEEATGNEGPGLTRLQEQMLGPPQHSVAPDQIVPSPQLLRRSSSVSSQSSLVTDNTCSICLDDFKAGETAKSLPECSHLFHDACLKQWYQAGIPNFQNQGVDTDQLARHKTCPKCRRKFSVRNSDGQRIEIPDAVNPIGFNRRNSIANRTAIN